MKQNIINLLAVATLFLMTPEVQADSSTPPTQEGYTSGTAPGSFDRFYPHSKTKKPATHNVRTPDTFSPTQGLN